MTDKNDTWKKIEERDALLAKQVFVEGNRIVLDVMYPYEIAFDRCDTHAKILAWLVHLADKTWVSPEIMQRFALLSASQHGLELGLP